MSAPKPMPAARRRVIPGMPNQATSPPAAAPPPQAPHGPASDAASALEATGITAADETCEITPSTSHHPGREGGHDRWPASDYGATRLTNFRLPVDLHDRYRRLVHDAEQQHPRLRRASLTEVIIALLEEGPKTPEEVARLIRRKRAAEHGLED